MIYKISKERNGIALDFGHVQGLNALIVHMTKEEAKRLRDDVDRVLQGNVLVISGATAEQIIVEEEEADASI